VAHPARATQRDNGGQDLQPLHGFLIGLNVNSLEPLPSHIGLINDSVVASALYVRNGWKAAISQRKNLRRKSVRTSSKYATGQLPSSTAGAMPSPPDATCPDGEEIEVARKPGRQQGECNRTNSEDHVSRNAHPNRFSSLHDGLWISVCAGAVMGKMFTWTSPAATR
jgi:hypothetical protein